MSGFDIRGLEWDWFAVDAAGQVGMFSTAGGGLAPPAILHDEDYFAAALDARERLIAEPPNTTARRAPRVGAGLRNDWRLLAERGCYGFDSTIAGNDYRRVAVPAQPRPLEEFSPSLRTLFARVQLHGNRFAHESCVAASSWLSPMRPELGTGGRVWFFHDPIEAHLAVAHLEEHGLHAELVDVHMGDRGIEMIVHPQLAALAHDLLRKWVARQRRPACPDCGAKDVVFEKPSPLGRVLRVLTMFFPGHPLPRIVGRCPRCGYSWRS